MNIGTIIAWILANTSTITTIIQGVETIATDLQQFNSNSSLDAYAKGVLAAIESFFQSLGANTSTTPAEQATIASSLSPTGAATPAADPTTDAANASGSAP
jgi:hypothetical protein